MTKITVRVGCFYAMTIIIYWLIDFMVLYRHANHYWWMIDWCFTALPIIHSFIHKNFINISYTYFYALSHSFTTSGIYENYEKKTKRQKEQKWSSLLTLDLVGPSSTSSANYYWWMIDWCLAALPIITDEWSIGALPPCQSLLMNDRLVLCRLANHYWWMIDWCFTALAIITDEW
jgi:hypothetical protein